MFTNTLKTITAKAIAFIMLVMMIVPYIQPVQAQTVVNGTLVVETDNVQASYSIYYLGNSTAVHTGRGIGPDSFAVTYNYVNVVFDAVPGYITPSGPDFENILVMPSTTFVLPVAHYVPDNTTQPTDTGSVVVNVTNSVTGNAVLDGDWQLMGCNDDDGNGTVVLNECNTAYSNPNQQSNSTFLNAPVGYYGLRFNLPSNGNYTGMMLLSQNPQELTTNGTITFNLQYTPAVVANADPMLISHTVTPNQPAVTGDTVTYTISYGNGSTTTTATGVQVVDNYDETNLQIANIVSPASGCTDNGLELVCNLGDLAANATGTIVYQATVITPASNLNLVSVDNIATISSTSTDSNPGNNTASERLIVDNSQGNNTGTIQINMNDDAATPNAVVTETWTLYAGTNNSGTVVDTGTITETLTGITAGQSYFLEVTNNGGYVGSTINPANPQTVTSGNTTTFDVVYGRQPNSGIVVIDMQDDSTPVNDVNAPWTLYNGANNSGGVEATGTGDMVLPNVPVSANYFLETALTGSFVRRTITPANPQAVNNGVPTNFVVTYSTTGGGSGVDVQLIKSANLRSVLPNSVITYTLDYQNLGTNDATDVRILDNYDENLVSVSGTLPAGCQDDVLHGEISCTIGALAAGASGQLSYQIVVDQAVLGDMITNIADIVASEADDNPADNTSLVNVPVMGGGVNGVDVQLTKTANSTFVLPGGTIDYTIQYVNNGNQNATGVRVLDDYDETVLSVSGSLPTGCQDDPINGEITCTLGQVNAGPLNVGTLSYQLAVDPAATYGSFLTNTAAARSSETDADPTNNSDSVSVLVASSSQADPAIISKVADINAATPGDTINYTVTYQNIGALAVLNVGLEDTFSTNLINVNVTTPGCSVSGQIISCSVARLDAGEMGVINYSGQVDPALVLTTGATVDNTVQITGDTDVDPTNNSATVQVKLGPNNGTTGMIQINMNDDATPSVAVADTWTIYTGTDATGAVYATGTGTTTLSNVPVGDYFVVVDDVLVYTDVQINGSSTTSFGATVTGGNTTTFDVVYVNPIVGQPEITITKTASQTLVNDNDVITYTITVSRTNNDVAGSITVDVTDTITGQTALFGTRGGELRYIPNTGICEIGAGRLSCLSGGGNQDITRSAVQFVFPQNTTATGVIQYQVRAMTDTFSGTSLVNNTATGQSAQLANPVTATAAVTLNGIGGGSNNGGDGPYGGNEQGGGYNLEKGEMKLNITREASLTGDNYRPVKDVTVSETGTTRVYHRVTLTNEGEYTATDVVLNPYFNQDDSTLTANGVRNVEGAIVNTRGQLKIRSISAGKSHVITFERMVKANGQSNDPATDGLELVDFGTRLPAVRDGLTYVGLGSIHAIQVYAGNHRPETELQDNFVRFTVETSPSNAVKGQPVTYTIRLTNISDLDLTGLNVKHFFESVGITIDDASSARMDRGALVWTRDLLAMGDTMTTTFTGTLGDVDLDIISGMATISFNESDQQRPFHYSVPVAGTQPNRPFQLASTGSGTFLLLILAALSTLGYRRLQNGRYEQMKREALQ